MSEKRKVIQETIDSMTDNEIDAIGTIITEYYKAMKKHPIWPMDKIHAAAIVGEESGELIRAALHYNYEGGSRSEMEIEAIQTGAMSVRFLVNLYNS